jgi:hypothetical protein
MVALALAAVLPALVNVVGALTHRDDNRVAQADLECGSRQQSPRSTRRFDRPERPPQR